jgi:GntR family transcriptional regulator, transcriptional repressor for pyruvate dehydrogenase complex
MIGRAGAFTVATQPLLSGDILWRRKETFVPDSENLSQSDIVVRGIKDMIVRGELNPNDQLPIEKDLADALSVSRGSLREGVRALSVLGILETRQGSGTYVTNLEPALLFAPLGFIVDLQYGHDAEQLHSVRRVLETEAAGHAALYITDAQLAEITVALNSFELELTAEKLDYERLLELDIEFHRIVADASQNPVLGALITSLSSRTVRGRLLRAVSDSHAEYNTLAEHRAIKAALADHAPDRARLRMANHLLAVEDFLRRPSTATGEDKSSS